MSDAEYEERLAIAINKILNNDFMGQYFRVTRVNGETKPKSIETSKQKLRFECF